MKAEPKSTTLLHRALVSISRQARRDIDQLASGDAEQLIHTLRVRMKKLHALLPLVASCIAPATLEAIRSDMRIIKKFFATNRDQHVMEALLTKLCHNDGAKCADVLRASRPQPPQAKVPVRAGRTHFRRLKAAARSLTRRLQHLRLQELTWPDIASAFADRYAQARRHHHSCKKTPTTKRLHRWRTPVKDHYFQSLIILRSRRHCKRARKLAALLGNLHDLALLKDRLNSGASDELLKAIDHRMKKLRAHTFRKARRTFAIARTKLKRRVLAAAGL